MKRQSKCKKPEPGDPAPSEEVATILQRSKNTDSRESLRAASEDESCFVCGKNVRKGDCYQLSQQHVPQEQDQEEATMRKEVEQRLAMALAVVDDPATAFCVQPFTSVERDGGEQLGKLLARVMGDPDHALLVATGTAFVFAFRDQLGQSETNGVRNNGATEGPS